MADDKQNKVIFCPACNGGGQIEHRTCSSCQGVGTYMFFDDNYLIWKKSYTPTIIYSNKIQRGVNQLINLLLLLIALAGLSFLFFQFYYITTTGVPILMLASWQNFKMLGFWSTMPFMMYLFYRISREDEGYKNVMIKSFDSEQVSSLKKRGKKIDISHSFSLNNIKALERAYHYAVKDQESAIQPIHVFAALLSDEKVSLIFARLGINVKQFQKQLVNIFLKDNIVVKNQGLNLSTETLEAVFGAYQIAYDKRKKKTDIAELIESLVLTDERIREILYDRDIDADKIKNVAEWIRTQELLQERYLSFRKKAFFKPKGVMNRAMTAVATPFLDLFSEDLTQLSRSGYLNLCVGREKELEDIYSLIDSGQRAVILVGFPGVGKTNIVEGVANNMVAEEVPIELQDKRFVSLSLSKLIAGAQGEGELENRILGIMNEIAKAGNIILFIDNIHNMVGATSVGTESLDLSEVFSEFIKKYNVITISTTTPGDYTKYIESNPLGQYFEKVKIEEPDFNKTVQIMEAKVTMIENKERVYFSYEALEKIVELSKRYIPDRYFPEKAILIMTEVAGKVRRQRGKNWIIDGEDVAGYISEKTSIPLTQITQKESEKLLNLEKVIHQRMVDQDEAVNFVANALRRARTEIRDAKKPIVNLLFLGPTGVGKTELAKTVAEVYFGEENKMIRLDMSEYQNKDSLDRLIGSASGGQAGQLTEVVRKKPFSILLLDELEKAHPDILNVFLQVMDDGRLTDGLGRTIDFTNIILIATSNANTTFIQQKIQEGWPIERIKTSLIQGELKDYFRPEFLNRFSGVVVFKPLSEDDLFQITKLLLKKLEATLEVKGIRLEATDEAVRELAHEGYDPIFGARPLKRVIQEKVDNALANFLLTGEIGRRDKVILEPGGQIKIEQAKEF